MSEPRRRVWPIVAVLVPVLYVLSIGPAIWFLGWPLPVAMFTAFYTPLTWTADVTGTLDLLLWYMSLFEPLFAPNE